MADVKLLYFAWVRERIGRGEERLTLPVETRTVGELVAWLKTRGEEYASAFENDDTIRVAINQNHVDFAASLENAREVAFFPPVTGG
jgi:molybdopterin synthase sulfur carrier subunit